MEKKEDILSGTQELTLNDLMEVYSSDEVYKKDDIKIEYTDNLRTPDVILAEEREKKAEEKRRKAQESGDYDRVISNSDILRSIDQKRADVDKTAISKDYFTDKYNGSFYKAGSWFLKIAALVVGVFVVMIVASLLISLYNKTSTKKKNDITHLMDSDEKELEKALKLDFKESDYYTKMVPMLTNESVSAKADGGLAVIYLDDKRVGLFFDSYKFKAFGYGIGDKCDDKFENLKYDFNKQHLEEKGQRTGNREIYYLYSTKSNDCVVISIDKRKGIVRELGYFYDYKTVLGKYY